MNYRHVFSFFSKLIFVLLLCLMLFAFRSMYYISEDYEIEGTGGAVPAGFVLPDRSLQQKIPILISGSINSLNLQMATYARPDYDLTNGFINIDISTDNIQSLYTHTIPLSDLIDNVFHHISLTESISVKRGDWLTITLWSNDTDESNAPTIWLISSQSYSGHEIPVATAAGEMLPGSFSFGLKFTYFDANSLLVSIVIICSIVLLLFNFVRPRTKRRSLYPVRISIHYALLMLVIPFLSFVVFQKHVMGEVHTNQWNLLIPAIAFLGLHTILYAMTARFTVSFSIANLTIIGLYLANEGKRFVRGDVLLPSDLFAVQEASHFVDSQMVIDLINVKLVNYILLFIFIIILSSRYASAFIRKRIICRLGLIGVCAFMLFSFVQNTIYNADVVLDKFKITNIRWDPVSNVAQNGLFQVFLMNSDVLFVNKPEGYNSSNIVSFINSSRDVIAHDYELPDNVIVVMNESFFDLALVDSQLQRFDFMPYTRDIMSRYRSGHTIVPVIGGGTCNSEFEFLSGFSMSFLPSGSLPYQQYVHREVPSIASVFKDLGYKTVATHPNIASFWNRNIVYEHFLFDEFWDIHSYHSSEVELEHKRGNFTDKAVYDIVLNDIDINKESTFYFATTIQNHTPFDNVGDLVDYDVVQDESLTNDLQVFLNLMKKSDDDIQYFLDALNSREDTSVVLFFGDHAPALGSGFYDVLIEKDELDKYATPFFIYSTDNYKLNSHVNNDDRISLNYLGYHLLDTLGIRAGVFHDTLTAAYTETNILSPYQPYVSESGSPVKLYEYMQYYYLFDK